MLQSSIAGLDGSLMVIYRTLTWEVLLAFYLMEMSRLVELTRLMEVSCLRKYHISWKCHMRKKVFL